MKKINALLMSILLIGCCMVLSACGKQEEENVTVLTDNVQQETTLEDSPEWVAKLVADKASDAKQVFVVAGVEETTAYVSMHELDDNGTWKQIITTPGFIGKNGLGKTKEGDGKTPVGVFTFNRAFGIADDPGCEIPYKKVTDDDYWSGDPKYMYNQMVRLSDYLELNLEDSEHIIDYTYQYQYCLNISYNYGGIPGVGSAIFLHCLGPYKPYTGGCIAIPQACMETVMRNVDPDCAVIIDSLENISPETWEDWDL